ncbi:MAG: Asp-tRNA(Asn)/Glu-tRNA(Gln) amidotransferase subunit GatC [Epulopiscium sp.]|nr:Asp-tRNA(Asn)/Glu-tRNA(Gln) amidotransferase subunit GatC [Candidatus Epulonipiscium sp.]
MGLNKKDVLKLAGLAHLSLTESEAEEFAKDLDKMVSFAEELQGLDTSSIDLEDRDTNVYNVLRKDEVKPSMAKEELLANAPEQKEGCFFVPQIVE